MIKNGGKAKRWFGMHMVDGTAEYREAGRDPYKIFINETTLREMDASFSCRPVFVDHVDDVESNIDELKHETDGWVIRSFYNTADGKHWSEFITTSKNADRAIDAGWKLSNCYIPTSFGQGGMWNGMEYEKEIKSGEYEHLAIVANPRYEESIILSPDQFKKYNDDKLVELKRLTNNKNEGEKPMKFNFFKRAAVENSKDLEGVMVELPKSKREVTLAALINEADELAVNPPKVMNDDHMLDVDGKKMTLNELMGSYKAMCSEMEEMKKMNDEMDGDPAVENEDEDKDMKLEEEKEKEVEAEKKKNDIEAAAEKKAQAKEKADRLRTANSMKNDVEETRFVISASQIEKGKSRYGS